MTAAGRATRPRSRPLNLDDLARLVSLEELALAPDGGRVAVTLETVDEARNRVRRRIVLLDVERPSRHRTIAIGGSKLGSPRWSPDGLRLAFVSDRTKVAQLWIREVESGDRPATQITDHPRDVSEPAWSPDGGRIAFVAAGADRAGDAVPAEEKDPKRRLIRVRGHRHKLEGIGYLDGPLAHLWVLDVATGSTRQFTDGRASDASPAWSPDGRTLAFVSDRSAHRDRHFNGASVHIIDVGGRGRTRGRASAAGRSRTPRRVSPEDRTAALPSWSPDGKRIAYLRNESPDEGNGLLDRLWVADVATGKEECWTEDIDRSVGFRPGGYRTGSRPLWTPDGAAIFQLIADAGTTQLFRADAAMIERLSDGPCVVHEFSADDERRRVAFIRSGPTTPIELWRWDSGSGVQRVAGFNPWAFDEVRLAVPRRMRAARPDGTEIDAWLTVPTRLRRRSARGAGAGLPLVLVVHGGPHNAFGDTFYPDQQLWAAAGFAVLAVNPRGSGSYSEAFARAVVGDWGGADFADLLAALDRVIAEAEPPIDASRLAITGGSYGGFMTCWAITQTNRFAVAIAGAPVTNLETEYGTADIGPSWLRAEQEGSPLERPEAYAARSPIRFVERVRTPLLLYHGEADLRCPIEQSEQFFSALTALGGDVELIRVPAEGHVLPGDASPVHRRAVREAILEWLTRYVGGPQAG